MERPNIDAAVMLAAIITAAAIYATLPREGQPETFGRFVDFLFYAQAALTAWAWFMEAAG